MKIHIIGCSGTGKSYLAKKLSNKYKEKVYFIKNKNELQKIFEI